MMEGPEDITRVRARNALKVNFIAPRKHILDHLPLLIIIFFLSKKTDLDSTGRSRRYRRAKRRKWLQIKEKGKRQSLH